MKFPILVYKSPGTHQCPGGTFDYLQVCDEGALEEAALEGGYYPTIELAVKSPDDFDWEDHMREHGWFEEEPEEEEPEEEEPEEEEPEEEEPLTREELEAKAKELGIEFPSNIKDETLLKKIETKLAEQEE